ncbi:helix-hairpin-helix domain-containing protein [Erysipelothrix sp. D19-032]
MKQRVNQVGVDVNTKITTALGICCRADKNNKAQNIVTYREEHGIFKNRKAIKDVPRLGPKSYEQAIGFLRIPNGEYILDNTKNSPRSICYY